MFSVTRLISQIIHILKLAFKYHGINWNTHMNIQEEMENSKNYYVYALAAASSSSPCVCNRGKALRMLPLGLGHCWECLSGSALRY